MSSGRVVLPYNQATEEVLKSKCIVFLRRIFLIALIFSTKLDRETLSRE